jgi:hypothetical protein
MKSFGSAARVAELPAPSVQVVPMTAYQASPNDSPPLRRP